ncbi:MAG: hypothetical protein LAP40_07235 [Acidobacteriia bacterium]|nr:hypothetical protein [Terriglobia bacterium]
MLLRAFTCVPLLCAAGLLPAQDAREIIRRAVEQSDRNTKAALTYTYLQRQEVRELDGSGHVKKRTIQTWDITPIQGSPYRRLVARDDQPLPAAEQKTEDEKLRWNNEQRRKETSEERARRVAEWQLRQEREREPVRELPDAFTFTLAGEEQVAGRPVYRIDATPKPGYKPKSQLANFFPKVKLRLWIDQQDLQGARIEMEVLDTISFGGFVLRLSKGTRLTIEQTRLGDAVWLPKQVALTATGRILLVKGLNREFRYTFSDYKKFQVDSHVLAIAEEP